MSSMLDKKNMYQNEKKNKVGFIIVAIFIIWLILPFGNRFVQLSYFGYNIVYNVAKIFHIEKISAQTHLRNKAVYLAKAYPKKPEKSLKAINEAIDTMPKDIPHVESSKLYRDRAQIKLYYGDKKGALQDYMSIKVPDANDYSKIGLLLAEEGKYEEAAVYCKNAISDKYQLLSGYVCMANVYEKTGNIEEAIEMYNWAIGRIPDSVRAYVERAKLKRKINDVKGAAQDIEKAKGLSPYIDENSSIIKEILSPKTLSLSII